MEVYEILLCLHIFLYHSTRLESLLGLQTPSAPLRTEYRPAPDPVDH